MIDHATNARTSATRQTEIGREVACDLIGAIRNSPEISEQDRDEALATYARIALCNDDSNIWYARDLHTHDGDAYDGAGRFWNCNSKLCPGCEKRASRRTRNKIRNRIDNERLYVGENYRFITLTIPNLGLPLQKTRDLIDAAWINFRRRKWFTQVMIGGIKAEEFTITKIGIHYHLHLLAKSKYIRFSKIREQWTECVRSAFAAAGHDLIVNNVDNLLSVNVRTITSIDDAIKEVAKYITKSESWSKLGKESLIEFALIRRYPRMKEFFGDWRSEKSEGVPCEQKKNTGNKTILDKRNLSVRLNRPTWRDLTLEAGVIEYFDELIIQISEQSDFRSQQLKRKYGCARFWRLQSLSPGRIAIIRKMIADVVRTHTCPICDNSGIVREFTNSRNQTSFVQMPCQRCSAM